MADFTIIYQIASTVSPAVTIVAILLLWRLDATITKLQLTIAKEYATLVALDTVVDRVQFLEQKNMKG